MKIIICLLSLVTERWEVPGSISLEEERETTLSYFDYAEIAEGTTNAVDWLTGTYGYREKTNFIPPESIRSGGQMHLVPIKAKNKAHTPLAMFNF